MGDEELTDAERERVAAITAELARMDREHRLRRAALTAERTRIRQNARKRKERAKP